MAVQIFSKTNGVAKTGSNGYSGKPIVETLTNGFFRVDRKWTVTYWNKAAEKLLGVQAKDIIGKNLWEEFADVIPLEFYAVYEKAFHYDVPLHFEEYLGELGAWFEVITYHCDDTLSVSFKSSNHPHAEYPENPVQRLKVLTELYKFITEITNDCLWEWDLQTSEIFWIDGGHRRVFGYPIQNALIPQSFWESRLHPYDRLRVLARLNKIISEGSETLWEDEYRFQKSDGEYAYVCDRGHIIYDDHHIALRMIGATQDITEKKLAEIVLNSGIELIEDRKGILVQHIKDVVIELVYHTKDPLAIKFSDFLSKKLNHNYTYLSNLFSEVQGVTIEKFLIAHKIERVKELLVHNELSLTKIAYLMHYSSVAHLSSQFKKATGLSPSYYKHLRPKKSNMQEEVGKM
jgi:PAS domain S-box-containing protein